MTKNDRWNRLQNREILLLDGPMGTELQRKGILLDGPSWSAQALISHPNEITEIYKSYVAAGADILTANTFRTHERNLIGTPLENRGDELTKLAVKLTRSVAKENQIIAGSLSPLEDCYRSDFVSTDQDKLLEEHSRQAGRLADSGVDLILAETFGTISEASIAVKAGLETKLPTWISFVCRSDGKLLSGETISDAIRKMSSFGCDAFLLNCLPAPEAVVPLTEAHSIRTEQNFEIPLGVYANTGRMVISNSEEIEWESTQAKKPSIYSDFAKTWLTSGATIIGGCCGTTPDHIKALRNLIDD